MGTQSAAHSTMSPSQPGVLERAAVHVRQFVCGMHGHDELLHFDHGRISLLCSSCGHESPGWDVKSGESQRAESDATRRVVRMPLVGERRVA